MNTPARIRIGREGDATVRSIQRAAMIIKLLAEKSMGGLRLSDVARETGLGKATTHRLLTALAETGLVYQEPDSRLYRLGYEIVRLGQLSTRYDIAEMARPAMLRIARETGDTVYISVREGLDALCLERQVGDFPIKTLTLSAGDRRPLGVGAGSLALLAFLPEDEIDEIIASNRKRLAQYPNFAASELARLVARTRAAGYAFNEGRIVSAMCAIGVTVLDSRGRVTAAISVAAISERMEEKRVAWIFALLREEAGRLGRSLGAGAAHPPSNSNA